MARTSAWMMASVVLLAGSCGGATNRPPSRLAPAPEETRAELAGKRCDRDGVCKCRAAGDALEDPPPAEGTKRFEFRVGSGPGTVWVTINNSQVLLKTGEQVEQCFYIDLAAGKHEVVLRGQSERPSGGVGASLEISEYGRGGPWWFHTLAFACGLPGPCEPAALREWKAEVDGYPRSLRDQCGSTKLRAAQWETGKLPDGLHPDEIAVSVVLDVYPHEPEAGPGECKSAKKYGDGS